jgi:transcriptional regulator with XRE-family HTH domain
MSSATRIRGVRQHMIPNGLSEALRAARFEAGLTQQQLAKRVGMSTRSVQDYERGVRSPAPHLATFEEALGKPHGWFLASVNVLERVLSIEAKLDEIAETDTKNSQTLQDILGVLRTMMKTGAGVLVAFASTAEQLPIA